MNQVRFAVVGLVGLMAVAQGWVGPHRPYPTELSGVTSFRVTSSDDHGAGSLREAILSADRAGSHVRIEMLVAKVMPSAPLPPIINPNGVTLESISGQSVIDASEIPSGIVLEIRSKGSALHGIEIDNAVQTGMVVGADGLRVVRATLRNCKTGIELIDGGGDLIIEDSTFDKNQIGISADTFDRNLTIRKCNFLSQSQAGIWAVSKRTDDSAMTLDVSRCQFSDNRFGIVAANHNARIHDNDIALSHEAGVQLFGRGTIVEHNRIADGLMAGVQAEGTTGVVIADNEIFRNRTVAILLKDSAEGQVRKNNIYSNGNGVAFVYGSKESPNTAAMNSIFSQIGDAIVTVGQPPVLKDNLIRSNNINGTAHLPLPVGTPLNDPPVTSGKASFRPLPKGSTTSLRESKQ